MSYPSLSSLIEAIVYVAKEPVGIEAIQKALPEVGRQEIEAAVRGLIEKYRSAEHGIEIREIAEGLRFSTKPEHHEVLKKFVQSQTPPTRLSLAALETLAVIAYKQPVTIPEIQEIRGVHASGVIKTLLDKKLVAAAGRKEVLGRPILYKTTKEFLVHFGLNSLDDLPSMEEFEELIRSHASSDAPEVSDEPAPVELPLEEVQ